MPNMNSFLTTATLTLVAGAVPLVPMSSSVGALVDTIAILIAIAGSAITLLLYFSPDESGQAVATLAHNGKFCN